MKNFILLSKLRITFFSFVLIFIFLIFDFFYFFIFCLLAVLLFYWFRMREETYSLGSQIASHPNNFKIYSPVDGRAKYLSQQKVSFYNTVFHYFGIHAIQNAEVLSVDFNDRSVELVLYLKSQIVENQAIELFINMQLKSRLFKPVLWVKSGDRIKRGACIGYLPLGGKVILTIQNENVLLPSNYLENYSWESNAQLASNKRKQLQMIACVTPFFKFNIKKDKV